MDNHVGNFVLDEGTNEFGIKKEVRFEGDQIVRVHSYDPTPMLEQCAAERIATAGQRWGELRKVGTVPLAVYARMMALPDAESRKKLAREWLKQNKRFISFDRYAR